MNKRRPPHLVLLARQLDQDLKEIEAQNVRLRSLGYTDEQIEEMDRKGLIDGDGNIKSYQGKS